MPQLSTHRNDVGSDAAAQLARLVVASATFRELETERREALADALQPISRQLADAVVLHTCHRVELVAFADGSLDESLRKLPTELKKATGLEAVERVLLVASGLDSAVLAEEQVLGQVRDAYHAALAAGGTGPVTNELLRRAIHFGKRVQSFTQPWGERSLGDRALQWLDERMDRPEGRRAVVIGTGQMGRLLASGLASRGLRVTVASGKVARAAALAGELPNPAAHGSAATDDVLDGPLDADVVAIAQRAGAARLDLTHLQSDRVLVVDLSSPGAIRPEAAARLEGRLLTLDGLGAREGARRLTEPAERRLRREARAQAEAFVEWLATRTSVDAIGQLRARAEEIRRRHLQRLRRRQRLDESQAAEVEAMAAAMFGELLHEPIVRMRQGSDAARGVREAFGLE